MGRVRLCMYHLSRAGHSILGALVIASNLYIGGFWGEWGTLSSGKNSDTTAHHCQRKIEMLTMEDVEFTSDGYLADESLIWRGFM
ncbi:hypothetical protein JVU11DRAFT_10123 [Chiua virens]|nr:hypothetical protein JVU11DRAFT_10123 [Chiua virens]